MAYNVNIAKAPSTTRVYANFSGVDFQNDRTQVATNRSPNAVNLYKNYKSTLGQAVETRPGLRLIHKAQAETVSGYKYEKSVKGIFLFEIDGNEFFVIHVVGREYSKLVQWTNYPIEDAEFEELFDVTEDEFKGFVSENKFYMLNGSEYFAITANEGSLSRVEIADFAFVPTTYTMILDGTVSPFQPYNLLTPKQKNQYALNDDKLEYEIFGYEMVQKTDIVVTINGETKEITTDYTIKEENDITYVVLVSAPTTNDTMVVEFSQDIDNEEIYGCSVVQEYDGRFFFTGNKEHQNKVFYSMRGEPSYVGYSYFVTVGGTADKNVSLLLVSDALAVIKEKGENGTVYLLSRMQTGSDELTVTYAVKGITSSVGCLGESINFYKDPVFLSSNGLMGISEMTLNYERNLQKRSGLIQSKLINEMDLCHAKLFRWNDYLGILVGGRIYLADSNQKYAIYDEMQYEWFFFDNIGIYEDGVFYQAITVFEKDGALWFGTENGVVLKLNNDMLKDMTGKENGGELKSVAYADDCINGGEVEQIPILSMWTTPDDFFGSLNRWKKTNKKGATAQLKSFAHSVCKVKVKTNTEPWKDIKRHNGGYFDFSDFDFSDFTFNTNDKTTLFFKPKQKKWEIISLCFYSDEVFKAFGIFSATLEAYILGYAKER